jgi:hypothetical protein
MQSNRLTFFHRKARNWDMKYTLSVSPSISRTAVKFFYTLACANAILFEIKWSVKSLKLERQHMMYNRISIHFGLTYARKFNIPDKEDNNIINISYKKHAYGSSSPMYLKFL